MGMKVTPRIKKAFKKPFIRTPANIAKWLSGGKTDKRLSGWNVFNKETSKPRGRQESNRGR